MCECEKEDHSGCSYSVLPLSGARDTHVVGTIRVSITANIGISGYFVDIKVEGLGTPHRGTVFTVGESLQQGAGHLKGSSECCNGTIKVSASEPCTAIGQMLCQATSVSGSGR